MERLKQQARGHTLRLVESGAECVVSPTQPDELQVSLAGELDACSAGTLEQALAQALQPDYRRIRICLADVEFIDSVGIRLVINLLRRKRESGEVCITMPRQRSACRALELIGIHHLARLQHALQTDPNAELAER